MNIVQKHKQHLFLMGALGLRFSPSDCRDLWVK